MRICFVSREFAAGGRADDAMPAPREPAARSPWPFAPSETVGASGHEVHVLSIAAPKVMPPPRDERHHTLDGYPTPEPAEAFKFEFQRTAARVRLALLDLHARHPFDCIEFSDSGAPAYFTLQGRRASGELAACTLAVRLHRPTRLQRRLNTESWLTEEIATLEACEDACLRLADLVISPTQSLLDAVRARIPIEGRRGVIIPAPVAAADHADVGRSPANRPTPPEVLFIGTLERAAGPDTFVEAALRLVHADLRFCLIGEDTPTGRGGRSMIDDLRRRIPPHAAERFTFDPTPSDGAAGAIRRAAMVCFPSRGGPCPDTLPLAMSLGASVIATRSGCSPELCGPAAFLIPPDDPVALAAAMRRLLDDHALRASLGEAAAERSRRHASPGTVLARTVEAAARAQPAQPSPSPPHESPLASIIIPYFNLGTLIRQTLRSVERQTLQDFEVIIVDDGSTDPASTREIESLAAAPPPGLRVVRQPNRGLSAARNAGIALARGRWIVPLDADDILDPRFLASAVEAARRNPDASVVSSLVTLFHRHPGDLGAGWIPIGFDRDLLAVGNFASCCTALIDRRALLDAGGYDEWLTSLEDWDLWCSLAERGHRAVIIPDFLIHTRIRDDSLTRTEVAWHGPRLATAVHARHPGLAEDAGRALSLRLSGAGGFDAQARAREIVGQNIRYRLADRVNIVLKRAGIQASLKRVARRVMRTGGDATV